MLKETKTLTQLASEHHLHPNVLRAWRNQALTDFAMLFDRRDSFADAEAAYQKQMEELYAEIGRLTTQVNFLKKIRCFLSSCT